MKVGNSEWHVKITKKASDSFKGKELTEDDKIIIRKWAQTVIQHGPEELRKAPSVWADHSLHGEWEGHRASSFSYKGRIIYKIEDKIVTVVVVKITSSHDYKKE